MLTFLYFTLFLTASASHSSRSRRRHHTLHNRASAGIPSGWTSQGCFSDAQTTRVLSSYSTSSSSNTPASCIATCSAKGWAYAGVEYGQECYCGSSQITTQALSQSECSMPCSGDSTQSCGNTWKVQIFKYTQPSIPSGWTAKGCYIDDSSNRALGGPMTSLSTNTPSSCISSCVNRGYALAGVEYGAECFCANTITSSPSTGQLYPSSDCSMPCPGDSLATCGAGGRIMIYSAPTSTTTAPAASSSPTGAWSAVGCYIDSSSSRTLQGYSTTSTSLSPASCMSTCQQKGYIYSGVEYGSECYCAQSITSTAQVAQASDCSTTCSDSSSLQTCGGNYRISVYRLGSASSSTILSSTSVPASTTSPTPSAGGWSSLGCYTDSVNSRALSVQITTIGANSNTPSSCASACQAKGYVLSGVEYASECYCGNSISTAGGVGQTASSSECTAACSGNPSLICGGTNRISIWSYSSSTSFSSAVPTSTPVPISSSIPTSTSSSVPVPTAVGWNRLGCFTDSTTSRMLTTLFSFSSTNSLAVCTTKCASLSFNFAGIEYGQECWCGNSLSYRETGQLTSDGECNKPCSGGFGNCGAAGKIEVWAVASWSGGAGWGMRQNYAGSNFFDGWDFWQWGPDPTHGVVDYQSASASWSSGLVSINAAGNAIMRIDTTPNLGPTTNRKSVRIQTKTTFTGGLVIMDVLRMPSAYGVWPAGWTVGVGQDWPVYGEIDIIEGVHQGTQNLASIHTKAGCTMPTAYNATGSLAFSANQGGTNCDAIATSGTGCGVRSSLPNNYGAPFNSNGGGVYTMKWDTSGIEVYFFPRGSIPQDIALNNPNPSNWGIPTARYPASTCNPFNYFQNHVIIFDTTLCGDWAGGSYAWNTAGQSGQPGPSAASATGYSTCDAFVRANGAAFADAYWEIKSVKLYQ